MRIPMAAQMLCGQPTCCALVGAGLQHPVNDELDHCAARSLFGNHESCEQCVTLGGEQRALVRVASKDQNTDGGS
jgi:hypothetical protein